MRLFFLFLSVSLIFFSCKKNKENSTDPPCVCPPDFSNTDFEPAWSPDGKYIAFTHGDSVWAKTGIYLICPDSNKAYLWHAGISVGAATWSPDGKWIAFNDGTQIWKKKFSGDSLMQLIFVGRNFFPSWSPNGQLVAYRRSYAYPETDIIQGVWVLKYNSGEQSQLYSGNCGAPFWKGSECVFFFRGAILSSGKFIGDSLLSYSFFTNKTQRLKFIGGECKYPKFSSIINKMAFSCKPVDSGRFQIWVMNEDGSSLKKLTNTQGYSCDWSPDGKKIVYTDSRASNGRLWIMNEDGSNKQQLTFSNSF